MSYQLRLPFPPETIEIPLSQRGIHAGKHVAIVDAIDKDLAEQRWTALGTDDNVYAINAKSKKHMHRVILERMLERPLRKGEETDHINRKKSDNRRSNLRVATRSQNTLNRDTPVGKSGLRGIQQYRKALAQIRVNGKTINLGRFDTTDEAYEVYYHASEMYQGEFASNPKPSTELFHKGLLTKAIEWAVMASTHPSKDIRTSARNQANKCYKLARLPLFTLESESAA